MALLTHDPQGFAALLVLAAMLWCGAGMAGSPLPECGR